MRVLSEAEYKGRASQEETVLETTRHLGDVGLLNRLDRHGGERHFEGVKVSRAGLLVLKPLTLNCRHLQIWTRLFKHLAEQILDLVLLIDSSLSKGYVALSFLSDYDDTASS